ncbi:prolyl aminopeptidase [Motiliproteus sp. MSK22-1]|uniref:prolyl aminopeptidase n=1 Tax=Motiliproteus sp. MSK22-1 TaxID=1897630 RepID=UPI000975C55B|nr:prolyl aminopeptidase [Motiliproteus sp. MSK22-1]OMH39225.1 prolyl aminopeptidase [Motiliproteus sp. MSK22-1]
MLTLFPEIQPSVSSRLPVSDGHDLYYEQSGNARGIPVLFVHGGPGGGTSEFNRRFFDPEKYRIILFDQRGCGKSRPHASIENNTTAHLIEDIEQLRKHLGIDQWLLFGGSWGTTLSLLYAQKYPDKVLGMILRGIFLCREQDIHWFYQHGASQIFPDFWKGFLEPIPLEEQHDLLNAYHRILTSDNEIARMSAAKSWSTWEAKCSTLEPSTGLVGHFSAPHVALALARLEAHYFVNKAFIEDNQIINNAATIQHIPTTIIHGRYDMVCPVRQALELHEVLPEAAFHIVRDAGHSAMEPGITDNLIKATNQFALRLA